MKRPDHAGLKYALDQIKMIQENGNHITAELSLADLIQLGGIAAVEYCGGPKILFKMGRVDAEAEGVEGLLPNPDEPKTMSATFRRCGFTDREIVAIMGIHTIGKAKADISGHEGRWTMNPYVFDNTYYKELLLGDKSKYLKTASDIELVKNPAFRPHVEQFAED